MTNEGISLLVNGPTEWYANLRMMLAEHGHTWLQQRERLVGWHATFDLNRQIATQGFFWVFGYERGPRKKVVVRFAATYWVEDKGRKTSVLPTMF